METNTVEPQDIPEFVNNAKGHLYLVGDGGNLSLITGSTYDSSLLKGAVAIETEHGTVYVDQPQEFKTLSNNEGIMIYKLNDLEAVTTAAKAYLNMLYDMAEDAREREEDEIADEYQATIDELEAVLN